MLSRIFQILLRGEPNTRWWRLSQVRNALLYVLVVLLCLIVSGFSMREVAPLNALQRSAFDWQMRWLRQFYPRPVEVDPVLIGIDESTVTLFPEPIALWHGHLAKVLEALTHAKPAAVGMDIVLPERSFENILPGVQLALIRSLVAIRQNTNATFVRTVSSDNKVTRLTPIHPSFLRMLGDESFGSDQVVRDPDDVSRRFSETELTVPPSFSGQIARALGKPVGEGYIDYSRGNKIAYIPMQTVIGWLQDRNEAELKRRFDGKVVLIGSLLKDRDQWTLPVALSNWESTMLQSGVVIHVQTLRSLLGAGLIIPLPEWTDWIAIFLLASIVWLRSSLRLFLFAGVLAPLSFLAISLLLLQANLLLSVITYVVTIIIALIARAIADGLETAAEKNRLKRSFSGSVSPAVMQEILAGGLVTGVSSHTMDVCILFSDIRGFTTLSEALSPEMVTRVLRRYFDRMVAVAYRYDGTIDKFIGDGMMVLFGAPKPRPNACVNAVMCARDMVFALRDLNREFERDGLPIFVFGVGINYGSAVVGYIGSSERYDYSAIGDVVNVASRLEGLTASLGCQVVMAESVKSHLVDCGEDLELVCLGEQAIRGHSPVQVWGIKIHAEDVQSAKQDPVAV